MTVTRFAPSPTGHIHVGNLRTALFNHLIARRAGGTFILRIDDTDPERSREEYVDAIREDLEWLGLTWDREERQSTRLERYHEAAQALREAGRLYEAFETPQELELKRRKQLNMGRPPVYDRAALKLADAEKDRLRAERGGHWRFLLDQQRIEWDDGILGPQSIDAASVSDPVLIRGDGQLLYTLASVTDDMDMGVTHVVRGLDHVTNTATQIQIVRALGGQEPHYAHHSLLTGPGGEALSKRLGTLSLRDLRAAGIQPQALLSLMARIGSGQAVEAAGSLDELAAEFELPRFGAAPTRFDPAELQALSARVVRAMPYDAVAARLSALGVPGDVAPALWAAVHENLDRVDDIEGWWALCRDGAAPQIADEDAAFVAQALALLPPRPWTPATWGAWTAEVKAATGRKGRNLFRPLRLALTGRGDGPDMGALLPLLQRIPAAERAGSA
ncbi:glutamate--tRNA ligase [Rhodobacteraceae bacterium 2CG4]|uniref:Glutamate--tRNA ligase n=1 Tax=Halovulum marinum TaxID=2662447 RepID=A0A6L5YUZ1_9RHOB|nr:glutamate--tRNA ligase [Halovulum marinum]MSU88077.1 glutamate--tRNA ligase [Halovulum marinum]